MALRVAAYCLISNSPPVSALIIWPSFMLKTTFAGIAAGISNDGHDATLGTAHTTGLGHSRLSGILKSGISMGVYAQL